ncbi:hypothetical protein Fmac_014012 [Flemingia macrophylla]|uniref:Uncharacterized protein n=1 Tax=Flemingia macrophylla TaxID=520843 RepID=A0ABD1MAH1_9FABA
MSDIAMLVAEEYERRVKHYKKGERGVGPAATATASASAVRVADLKFNLLSSLPLKDKILNSLSQPKTQFAIAASNSVFSA